MKNTILTLMAVCLVYTLSFAQIQTPAPSPTQKIEQKVGLTDVMVTYSRPGKKGRTIYGDNGLVKYDKFWRTGANAATKIEFGNDVKVAGNDVSKGEYAILTKPSANSWMVYMYPYQSRSWGSYIEQEPTVSFETKPMKLASEVETFTIDFQGFTDSGADMHIKWGNMAISIPITVQTDAEVMATIDRVMAGPTNNDYYNAASYFHSSGKDLNQALTWIQKATKVDNPKFWQVRREALILADLGKYKDAITAAKKSKELAMAAGNEEYVEMNTKSIAEWMKKS